MYVSQVAGWNLRWVAWWMKLVNHMCGRNTVAGDIHGRISTTLKKRKFVSVPISPSILHPVSFNKVSTRTLLEYKEGREG